MAIEIKIQFNGKQLTIPINPEELNLSRSAENTDIDIIGIGPVTRKGAVGLYKLTIESFFPGENSYYYTGVKPKSCVDFIDEIWKTDNNNNNVAKIVTTGLLKNLNMYFVIENFEWNYKAGEEEDIYYTLEIKEYVPYGVKVVPQKLVNGQKKTVKSNSKSRTSSTSAKKSKKNTYKVQKGDCLWNIAKAASGKGSNWKALYNLNKKVIGSNPNLIKPGQILTLPDGWKGSFKVSKLTGTSKKTSTKKGSVTKSKTSSNTTKKLTPKQAAAQYKAGGGGYMSAGGGKGSKGQNTRFVLQPKQSALSKLVANKQKSLLAPKKSPLQRYTSGGGGGTR